MIVTEMGVLRFVDGTLTLTELNPEYTLEEVRAATDARFAVAEPLAPME